MVAYREERKRGKGPLSAGDVAGMAVGWAASVVLPFLFVCLFEVAKP